MTVGKIASPTGLEADSVLLKSRADRTLVTYQENEELIDFAPPLSSFTLTGVWQEEIDSKSASGKIYKTATIGATLSFDFWGSDFGILFNRFGGEWEVEFDNNPLTVHSFGDFSGDTFRREDYLELVPNLELDVNIKHTAKITAIDPDETYIEAFALSSGYFPRVVKIDDGLSTPLISLPYISKTIVIGGVVVDQLEDLLQIFGEVRIVSDKDISIKLNSSANDSIPLKKFKQNLFSRQFTDKIYITTTSATNIELYVSGK